MFGDAGPTDDSEVRGAVQELAELLVGRLLHSQRVQAAHGIGLPYPRPVTEPHLIPLLPQPGDDEGSL